MNLGACISGWLKWKADGARHLFYVHSISRLTLVVDNGGQRFAPRGFGTLSSRPGRRACADSASCKATPFAVCIRLVLTISAKIQPPNWCSWVPTRPLVAIHMFVVPKISRPYWTPVSGLAEGKRNAKLAEGEGSI